MAIRTCHDVFLKGNSLFSPFISGLSRQRSRRTFSFLHLCTIKVLSQVRARRGSVRHLRAGGGGGGVFARRAHLPAFDAIYTRMGQRPPTEAICDSRWFLRVVETLLGEDDRESPRKPRTTGASRWNDRSSKSDWERPRYASQTKRKSLLWAGSGMGAADDLAAGKSTFPRARVRTNAPPSKETVLKFVFSRTRVSGREPGARPRAREPRRKKKK